MVGQHIRILKGGRWVHAVDCGDETVLHLVEEAPPPRVRRAYRPEFVAGAEVVEVVTHRERTFPPKEIVKRAYSRASDPALASMFGDSESFVEWCTTGRLAGPRNFAVAVPGFAPVAVPDAPASAQSAPRVTPPAAVETRPAAKAKAAPNAKAAPGVKAKATPNAKAAPGVKAKAAARAKSVPARKKKGAKAARVAARPAVAKKPAVKKAKAPVKAAVRAGAKAARGGKAARPAKAGGKAKGAGRGRR